MELGLGGLWFVPKFYKQSASRGGPANFCMSQAEEVTLPLPVEQRRMVIVGSSKPLMNYITACITMFNTGVAEVLVRARGQAINPAVDVVELLRRRFMSDIHIRSITIDGDTVIARDGRQLTLPVLEILLAKNREV